MATLKIEMYSMSVSITQKAPATPQSVFVLSPCTGSVPDPSRLQPALVGSDCYSG